MKKLNVIIAFLICYSTFGQNKTYYNITKQSGDSTFWFKYITERTRRLSLPSLDTFSKGEVIRIWTNTQIIEIWQVERGACSGRLITWTDEYVGDGEEPTNRTFSNTRELSSDTVLLLNKLLRTSNILALPTENSIAGWQHGLDGITYFIEHSTQSSYSFKSYWTPTAQGALKEALQIRAFIDSAFCLANAQSIWKAFCREIPFESYHNGGSGVAIRILTEKERKRYRRERQNYRRRRLDKKLD